MPLTPFPRRRKRRPGCVPGGMVIVTLPSSVPTLASAMDVVIQLERLSDGRRRLTSLQEITGMEGDVVTMQEIFVFERRGVDQDGNVQGDLVPTGLRPHFAKRLQLAGIALPIHLFERRERAAV